MPHATRNRRRAAPPTCSCCTRTSDFAPLSASSAPRLRGRARKRNPSTLCVCNTRTSGGRAGCGRSRGGRVCVSEVRVGIGIDAHAFSEEAPLVLGGVDFPGEPGLAGHSDGDVIAHALIDALLGAAGLGDIGELFPSGDPLWLDASSTRLLQRAYEVVKGAGWELVNADCVLVGEEPRIAPVRDAMRARLAGAMGVELERVAVRATTTDELGFTGRGEGLAAQAVALLRASAA